MSPAFSAQKLVIASKGFPVPIFSFTQRTLPGTPLSAGFIWSMAVDPQGIFVILGRSNGAGDVYAVSSPDGITWTERTTPFSQNNDRSLTCYYGDGIFVAVMDASGGSQDPEVVQATGEGNWTIRDTAPNTTDGYTIIAYKHDGTTMYAAWLGPGLFSSPTAETWTSRTNPDALLLARQMYYGTGAGGFFLRMGLHFTNNNTMQYSADGLTWTAKTMPTTTGHELDGAAYSPELDLWVIVGVSDVTHNAVIFTATDPSGTWTLRTSGLAHPAQLDDVAYLPGYGFIAVGYVNIASNLRARIITSTDGITWVEETDHPFRDTNASRYWKVHVHPPSGKICITEFVLTTPRVVSN